MHHTWTWITATDQRTYKQRYRILDDIENRPLTVGELASIHRVSKNTVRRHIQILRKEGVMIRYNPSDKKYYSASHILKEEERRKRQMIPGHTDPSTRLEPARIEEAGHKDQIEIRLEDIKPVPGVTRWYTDRNTVWITKILKTAPFRGEECIETRRDVYNSAMKHICYSFFYEQLTEGGRYLLGDVQTSASLPTMPVICYHKPRETIHPFPLTQSMSWEETHIEEQPYYSPRAKRTTRAKTQSETRGTYRVTVNGHTYHCLRVLRARSEALSEIYLSENGVEVLLRHYLSQDSPGWREEMKTQPVIKLADKAYHLKGSGMAITDPIIGPT